MLQIYWKLKLWAPIFLVFNLFRWKKAESPRAHLFNQSINARENSRHETLISQRVIWCVFYIVKLTFYARYDQKRLHRAKRGWVKCTFSGCNPKRCKSFEKTRQKIGPNARHYSNKTRTTTMSGRGKGKSSKKAVSRSAKAGLQFPVGRIARYVLSYVYRYYFMISARVLWHHRDEELRRWRKN